MGEALAADVGKGGIGAVHIVEAQRRVMIVAELELA